MFLNKKLFLLLITIALQGSLILPAVSIAQVSINALSKNDSITNEEENYRKAHKDTWWLPPIEGCELYCFECRKSYGSAWLENGRIIDYRISNDTLIFTTAYNGRFNIPVMKAHYISLKWPKSFYNPTPEFLYHIKVFRDSCKISISDIPTFVKAINDELNLRYWSEFKKHAPFGFVDEWSWDKKYSNLSFSIKYTNTNSKTIKYLTVYFKATNSVGDVRKIGHFQGTGPLEEWETGTWDFDYSDYYVAGDTNYMVITKIVITYMNGSKKILTKNKIVYK